MAESANGRPKKKRARRKRARRKLSGKKPPPTPTPEDCIKALKSPLRRVILRELHRVGEARSPAEIAAQHPVKLSDTSYHFRTLQKHKMVALTGTRPSRGALEHFYASTVNDDALVISLLESTKKEDEETAENLRLVGKRAT